MFLKNVVLFSFFVLSVLIGIVFITLPIQAEDVNSKLSELVKAHESGLISETEYRALRQKI